MIETLDARGLRCPWPVLRLARALRDADCVSVMVDDPSAPEQIAQLAEARGWQVHQHGEMIVVARRAA